MKFFTRPSHSQKDLGFRLFLVTGVCVNYNSGRKTFEIGGGGGGGGGTIRVRAYACESGGMLHPKKLDALRLLLSPLLAQSGTAVIIVICTTSHV